MPITHRFRGSSPINWELIERQLDAMVKHAAALKLGMANAKSILIQISAARWYANFGLDSGGARSAGSQSLGLS